MLISKKKIKIHYESSYTQVCKKKPIEDFLYFSALPVFSVMNIKMLAKKIVDISYKNIIIGDKFPHLRTRTSNWRFLMLFQTKLT